MCFDIDEYKNYSSKLIIKHIDKDNVGDVNNIFKLFDKAFNWKGNNDKIKELLNEEYRFACVVDKDNYISGAVCWSYLKDVDFSRLEYLAVREDQRRNGMGEALIYHVIKDSINNKVKNIYLSTGINNNAANLYEKVGFYENMVIKIYERDIINE